jgi:hypothetical protein
MESNVVDDSTPCTVLSEQIFLQLKDESAEVCINKLRKLEEFEPILVQKSKKVYQLQLIIANRKTGTLNFSTKFLIGSKLLKRNSAKKIPLLVFCAQHLIFQDKLSWMH